MMLPWLGDDAMKTVQWMGGQRALLARRADKIVRVAATLFLISCALALGVVIVRRWADHPVGMYVVFGMALLSVALLVASLGVLLPLPWLVHQLKQMDDLIAEQRRREASQGS
jgi:hypothetical protein